MDVDANESTTEQEVKASEPREEHQSEDHPTVNDEEVLENPESADNLQVSFAVNGF